MGPGQAIAKGAEPTGAVSRPAQRGPGRPREGRAGGRRPEAGAQGVYPDGTKGRERGRGRGDGDHDFAGRLSGPGAATGRSRDAYPRVDWFSPEAGDDGRAGGPGGTAADTGT